MKLHQRVLIFTAAVAGGVGVGLYFVNRTELGSLVKAKLGHLNPRSYDVMQTMSEEVAMRAAQAMRNPKINQAWTERQWEEVGY